jgi:hypothetical protein
MNSAEHTLVEPASGEHSGLTLFDEASTISRKDGSARLRFTRVVRPKVFTCLWTQQQIGLLCVFFKLLFQFSLMEPIECPCRTREAQLNGEVWGTGSGTHGYR